MPIVPISGDIVSVRCFWGFVSVKDLYIQCDSLLVSGVEDDGEYTDSQQECPNYLITTILIKMAIIDLDDNQMFESWSLTWQWPSFF